MVKGKRTGIVSTVITGMTSTIPVGAQVTVCHINKEKQMCTVEKLDGTCCTVSAPLSHIQLDSYVSLLENGNETYAHNFCPNCPSRHEVRLIGHNAGSLDNIRFGNTKSKDIVGGGDTFEQAAEVAWELKYGM